MKERLLAALAVFGLLLSAATYCPPGAEAAPSRVDACCRSRPASKRHCPPKSKKGSTSMSCCGQAVVGMASEQVKLASLSVLSRGVAAGVAPQVVAHRLARSSIRPAGPPPWPVAALGNRAPPLA